MSRSYKHTPVSKDCRSAKAAKRRANHVVRRYKGKIANGKQYRRLFSSYDIHDYVFYVSRATWLHRREKFEKECISLGMSMTSFYQTDHLWQKYYFRK